MTGKLIEWYYQVSFIVRGKPAVWATDRLTVIWTRGEIDIIELEIGSFVGGEIVGFITSLTKKISAAGHAYKTEIPEWH